MAKMSSCPTASFRPWSMKPSEIHLIQTYTRSGGQFRLVGNLWPQEFSRLKSDLDWDHDFA